MTPPLGQPPPATPSASMKNGSSLSGAPRCESRRNHPVEVAPEPKVCIRIVVGRETGLGLRQPDEADDIVLFSHTLAFGTSVGFFSASGTKPRFTSVVCLEPGEHERGEDEISGPNVGLGA